MKYTSIILTHYSQPDDSGQRWKKSSDDERFNRSNLLRKCLDSLIENTKYPVELIVMDNGGNPDDSDYLLGLTRKGIINIYVRNKNNMLFGWTWNQGKALATGKYICFTCNDLYFKPGWLSSCIKLLEENPDKELIATPYHLKGRRDKYFYGLLGEGRLYSLAGSNCMISTREIFDKIGRFNNSSVAGTLWQRRMSQAKIQIIVPPENMAEDLGILGGANYHCQVKVIEELMKGEIIDFTNRK